jgi:hypothetical protein
MMAAALCGRDERSDMNNTALLHNVGDRAAQATSLAEQALRGVADRVADTASDVGSRVYDASSVLPGRHRRRPKHHVRRLVLIVTVAGVLVAVFKWRRRAQTSELSNDGMRPYPTDDPAYDQNAIDEAAERMGSTGHGGKFDPDPTNSHDPGALDDAARRMGVQP